MSNKILQPYLQIIDIGREVYNDDGTIPSAWSTKLYNYRNGYCVKRKVILEGEDGTKHKYNLINSIKMASAEDTVPLFETRIYDDSDELINTLISKNPTTTFKTVYENLNVTVKGKLNGSRFYGFLTRGYESEVKWFESNLNKENEHRKSITSTTVE